MVYMVQQPCAGSSNSCLCKVALPFGGTLKKTFLPFKEQGKPPSTTPKLQQLLRKHDFHQNRSQE